MRLGVFFNRNKSLTKNKNGNKNKQNKFIATLSF